MLLSEFKRFDLGACVRQVRSIPVKLKMGEEAILFIYSGEENIDPGEEYYKHPSDSLKISLFDMKGTMIWTRDLGRGVIPGIWFCPVISLDLNMDGQDEIYFVNNLNPEAPFSFLYRYLEEVDPVNGNTVMRWKWPDNTFDDRMSLSYRFYLVAGYSNGKPVLITSQGTYGDMYLQGYGPGMVKKWETVIRESDAGPRASHLTPVLDFNDDGIDELFWGERLLSVENGQEVFCYAKEEYRGHSDVIIPFVDFENGKRYIYTCREGDEEKGVYRVVTFNEDGSHAWNDLTVGHMHAGWLATIEHEGKPRRIAAAVERKVTEGETGLISDENTSYYYDAYTGKRIELEFPGVANDFAPLDINGDGYSEFLCTGGACCGCVYNFKGELIGKIEGKMVKNGIILSQYPCDQIMTFDQHGVVRVYGDKDAEPGELFKKRHEYKGFHSLCQRLMASGYNNYKSNMSCCI